jgi:probable F420-dependent oxidoreductase
LSPQQAIGAAAASANEFGFHSVWVAEHVLMPRSVRSYFPFSADHVWRDPADQDWMDPILTLAWAGAHAPDVELATGVMVLPLRNPMLLAKQIATLDVLSSGRVLFGIGVGWMREEFDAVGASFDERWPRTEEMLTLMRQLWTGEPVEFSGRFYSADGVVERPTPVRQPPIIWGGRSRRTLRCVAQYGDGWYPSGLTMDEFVSAQTLLKSMCAEHRRDFNSLITWVSLGGHRVSAALVARYAELGVEGIICSAPRDDIDAYRAELERLGLELGLTRRARRAD